MINKDIQYILEEKYNGNHSSEKFKKDIGLYEKGVPLGYIIGFVPFLDCKIDLSYRTLIPRVETEYWVEKIINTIPKDFSGNICDVFAGSGCIGISIAKKFPSSKIVFLDNSENAIKQIKKNITINNIEKQAQVIKSNVFLNLGYNQKFDYIFANPPYLSKKSSKVEKSVIKYEPHNALFAEENGFELIQTLIIQAIKYLEPKGYLIIEHDPEQKNKIHKIADAVKYSKIVSQKDQYDKYRYTSTVR